MMLYLEDYLEMIEHLPQELRDRFTEMREMDLSVQNSMDSLEKRVKTFFSNAKKMKPSEKEAEYETIRKDYYKTLEDADEKVHLASQMYDLVDRYLRRLDQELHKFKIELEANNKGITEVLQKRSLELDQPQANSSQKENRFSFNSTRASHHEKRRDSTSSTTGVEKRLAVEKASSSIPEPRPATSTVTSGSVSNPAALSPAAAPNVNYNLAHIGAGGNAIAAAASQAIAATQQMQQGRRTASLKASYEAINIGAHAEFSIGKELAGAAQTAIAAIQETTKKQKNRKSSTAAAATSAASSSSSSSTSLSVPTPVPVPVPPAAPAPSPMAEVEENSDMDTNVDPNAENPDWTYDPNEPRYCICNQVSYGYMVACDNQDCPFEWFHYACVDVKATPKGKWYCPQCTASMKRRGSRKN